MAFNYEKEQIYTILPINENLKVRNKSLIINIALRYV
eukprot:UN12628